MKQARRLKHFKIRHGRNNDDFIQARYSFVIEYKLDRQRIRRRQLFSFPETFLNDKKFLSQQIYTQFKESNNIRHI